MTSHVPEEEVLWARRAWGKSQALLDGSALRNYGPVAVGWHEATTHHEVGAFAVVRTGGPWDELIGEILRLTYANRSVFVYCFGGANVPTDLSLSRPAFLRLALLSNESVNAIVEVVQ